MRTSTGCAVRVTTRWAVTQYSSSEGVLALRSFSAAETEQKAQHAQIRKLYLSFIFQLTATSSFSTILTVIKPSFLHGSTADTGLPSPWPPVLHSYHYPWDDDGRFAAMQRFVAVALPVQPENAARLRRKSPVRLRIDRGRWGKNQRYVNLARASAVEESDARTDVRVWLRATSLKGDYNVRLPTRSSENRGRKLCD